jgi:hypothetical protein
MLALKLLIKKSWLTIRKEKRLRKPSFRFRFNVFWTGIRLFSGVVNPSSLGSLYYLFFISTMGAD